MAQTIRYEKESRTVPFQGKTIALECLTPILIPEEREKRKEEIERRLYSVFIKYRGEQR